MCAGRLARPAIDRGVRQRGLPLEAAGSAEDNRLALAPRAKSGTEIGRWLRGSVVLAMALGVAACSSYRPWQNEAAAGSATLAPPARLNERSLVVMVTLSGGGARAAAFGLGVLREMKATSFRWEGRETTLLDETSVIAGVSGGSVLAAYFAAFGDAALSSFEGDFLLADFQPRLIAQAMSPGHLHRLTSPWYGRSNVLAEQLDTLYRGATYGDLAARHGAPYLLVTATDLSTGAPFEFTAEQFALLCSDLREVPLSFAVAASSAVPLLLAPLTLHNHAGSCPANRAPESSVTAEASYRARLRSLGARAYADAGERPFIHLVDGGLSDNLGVRALMDRLMTEDPLTHSLRDARPQSIRKVVLIAVNAERDVAERIDRSDRVPTMSQVVDTLVFGAGARTTQVTLGMLSDDVSQWRRELERHRGKGMSPFAADAEIHVISLSLRDVAVARQRAALLQVPTAFTISREDVERLQWAGREVLRDSPDFQRLRASLSASASASTRSSARASQPQ